MDNLTGVKNYKLSDKQKAKFARQKCIQILEKICKNLFKMFRDANSTKEEIISRFEHLVGKLEDLGAVHLDSKYHREMKKFVSDFQSLISIGFNLKEIRAGYMSKLNRIQKTKKELGYRKSKH